MAMNFSTEIVNVQIGNNIIAENNNAWNKLLDPSDKQWQGPGSLSPVKLQDENEIAIRPLSFALYGNCR